MLYAHRNGNFVLLPDVWPHCTRITYVLTDKGLSFLIIQAPVYRPPPPPPSPHTHTRTHTQLQTLNARPSTLTHNPPFPVLRTPMDTLVITGVEARVTTYVNFRSIGGILYLQPLTLFPFLVLCSCSFGFPITFKTVSPKTLNPIQT